MADQAWPGRIGPEKFSDIPDPLYAAPIKSSAPEANSSLPSGESDPVVKQDCAGADPHRSLALIDALDNSQSLLVAIYHLGTVVGDGSIAGVDWENEGLAKQLADQIDENRAALTATSPAEALYTAEQVRESTKKVVQEMLDTGQIFAAPVPAQAALGISLERAAKTVRPFNPRDILRTTVVGKVSGEPRDGDQVPGMSHAICHACGLGYKCMDVDCPNEKPNPVFSSGT